MNKNQDELLERLRRQEEERAKELQKRALLRKLLEPKARERLANIRLANPELAEQVENLILYLYQAGQLGGMITEEQFKKILEQVTRKRKTKIVRK